jgi:hypothetical protein
MPEVDVFVFALCMLPISSAVESCLEWRCVKRVVTAFCFSVVPACTTTVKRPHMPKTVPRGYISLFYVFGWSFQHGNIDTNSCSMAQPPHPHQRLLAAGKSKNSNQPLQLKIRQSLHCKLNLQVYEHHTILMWSALQIHTQRKSRL